MASLGTDVRRGSRPSSPAVSVALVAGGLALLALAPNVAFDYVGASVAASVGLEGVPHSGHVFLILGENTDYSALKRSNSPFLLETVRPHAAWFTEYFAATHWSEANYVGLVSGQYNACEQADGSPASCHQNVANVFHALDAAGLTWNVWLDGGNAACPLSFTTTEESSSYFTTGNPPTIFDDIEGPNGVWSSSPSHLCLSRDVPAGPAVPPFVIDPRGMDWFNQNLSHGTVANFNFIVPNGCDSADKNCGPAHDRYAQFDNFLKHEVPRIEKSPAFGSDGMILVLFDEAMRKGGMAQVGFGQGGRTVCAVLSPRVVPGDYGQVTYEYSVLRTVEDGFGLSPALGSSADVGPLPAAWK